jgi:hypothetical protein
MYGVPSYLKDKTNLRFDKRFGTVIYMMNKNLSIEDGDSWITHWEDHMEA